MRQNKIKTVKDLREFIQDLDDGVLVISTWESQLEPVLAVTDNVLLEFFVDGYVPELTDEFSEKYMLAVDSVLRSW